jgi:hypothetical protein
MFHSRNTGIVEAHRLHVYSAIWRLHNQIQEFVPIYLPDLNMKRSRFVTPSLLNGIAYMNRSTQGNIGAQTAAMNQAREDALHCQAFQVLARLTQTPSE